MIACTLCAPERGVAIRCARKRGHHGSKHHPFDPTKFLGICMVIKSIHKKKRQLRKGGRQEWRPVPQYSLRRGRRTLSSLGGDSGGHFYPGQHEGFGGVGRRSTVVRVVTSRSGRYPQGHLQEWPQGWWCVLRVQVLGTCAMSCMVPTTLHSGASSGGQPWSVGGNGKSLEVIKSNCIKKKKKKHDAVKMPNI